MGLVVIMVILANNIKNKSLSPILMLAARPSFVMDMKKILNNSSPLANNKFIKTVKIINIKTGFIEAIIVFNESLLKALIAIRTTNHKNMAKGKCSQEKRRLSMLWHLRSWPLDLMNAQKIGLGRIALETGVLRKA